MKTARSSRAPLGTEVATPTVGLVQLWVKFWFSPIDPIGLHALRLLSGLLFLAWLLPFAGNVDAFFGLNGWFDGQAYREVSRLPDGAPVPISWSALYLAGASSAALHAMYWGAIAVLVLFTLGVWPRITAVLAWLIVVSFNINPAISYDADSLLVILAFYLMVGYLLLNQWSDQPSLLSRILGPRGSSVLSSWQAGRSESYSANMILRLVQVHFALIIFVSALHKLQFGDWWSGTAFWYPMHPPFETTHDVVRVHAGDPGSYLFMLSLGQYISLAWQIGFPLFVVAEVMFVLIGALGPGLVECLAPWRRRLRVVLLGGALLGWIGSAFLYKHPLFGPIYCIGCLSFLAPDEWHWIISLLGRAARLLGRMAGRLPAPAEAPAKIATRV